MRDVEHLVSSTVRQYYFMERDQKDFIISLVQSNYDKEWNKYDLMKALMLYNESDRMGCEISDKVIDRFVNEIDSNKDLINMLLKKYDDELLSQIGIV